MIFQVLTVGISLLRNFVLSKVDEDLIKKFDMSSWLRLKPEDERQRIPESHAYAGSIVYNSLLKYVSEKPFEASAELNALHHFEKVKGIRKEEEEIILYSTDTGTGWLCSMILYEYLKANGYTLVSEPVRVEKFGWGPDFIDDALGDLMDKLVKLLVKKKKEGYRVYVNATGGLKPESTFLVISALLSSADAIYYMYQFYNDIGILPIIPLSIRQDYIEYLKKLLDGMNLSYIKDFNVVPDEILKDLEERKLIEIRKDGNVYVRKWARKLIELTDNLR